MPDGSMPFIGRNDAINAFHALLSTRAQRNVIFYQAGGGLGKTRLLRKIIEECQEKPNWYIGTREQTSPIIDFFESANQSIAGLRHSIIARLGVSYFQEFQKAETELRKAEKELNEAETQLKGVEEANLVAVQEKDKTVLHSKNIVLAHRRRVNNLFFSNLKNALTGRQVVLFFDTFEVIYHRHVGQWFLRELLPEAEGALIVVAGRPNRDSAALDFPPNVTLFPLMPFGEVEAREYFSRRGWHMPDEVARDLIARTKGIPLLIDLVTYSWHEAIAARSELNSVPDEQMELVLINRFVQFLEGTHQAIVEMAYLKRRYNAAIFAQRKARGYYADVPDYTTLCTRLLSSDVLQTIIKYREEDQILTLHDEVQRMLEQHAYRRSDQPRESDPRREWYELVNDLYEQIVCDYYNATIRQTADEIDRSLLIAELLAYELAHPRGKGLALYEEYWSDVRQTNDLNLAELIWGELESYLDTEPFRAQAYKLIYEQAEWLFNLNELRSAVQLLQLILDQYTAKPEDLERKLDALATLGHAFMRQGYYDKALRAFEQGLQLSREAGNYPWLSAFEQNIAQLKQKTSRWFEAEEWFKQASETAEKTESLEAQALARGQLGLVQALLGNPSAIANCMKAVSLRQDILNLPEREESEAGELIGDYYKRRGKTRRWAMAYVQLGHAYRYSGKVYQSRAQEAYEKALAILSGSGGDEIRSEAQQGLGNIAFSRGQDALMIDDLPVAIRWQLQALRYFVEAVAISREHGYDQSLATAFHRLAHVVFAIGQLQSRAAEKEIPELKDLLQEVNDFLLPEEDNWLANGQLREAQPLTQLDLVAKAQRLFEVSALEAEQIQDFNTSLDSLVEACNVARYRNRPQDVRAYNQLVKIPSEVHQAALFIALSDIVLADLALDENHLERALSLYRDNFPVVARSGGYGRHLLRGLLENLGHRILNMKRGDGLGWCNALIDYWTRQGLINSHPELIATVWEWRQDILGRQIAT